MLEEDRIINFVCEMLTKYNKKLSTDIFDKNTLKFMFTHSPSWIILIDTLKQGLPIHISPDLIDELVCHMIFKYLMLNIKETDSIRVEKNGDLTIIIDGETNYDVIIEKLLKTSMSE